MNLSSVWTRAAIAVVLAAFLAFTLGVLRDFGYVGFINLATADDVSNQVLIDLVIALTLVLAWIAADARREGNSYAPILMITLLFGSVGPLLYLLVRPLNQTVQRIVGLSALGVLCALVVLNWSAVR